MSIAARKLVVRFLVALSVVVCGLGLLAVSAFAAAPEAPVTEAASPVGSLTATLHGVLNPGALANTGWHFAYNTDGGCTNGSTSGYEPVAEVRDEKVSAVLTSLEPDTTYTVCLVAENEQGEETFGSAQTFTTSSSEPVISNERANAIGTSTTTLEANVNPEKQSTSCLRFEYGETTAYGSTTPCTPASLGEAFGFQATNASLTKLKIDRAYHFRVVVENKSSPVGGTYGADQTFTTLPLIQSDSFSNVGPHAATLNAALNVYGVAVTYRFEYGTTSAYGSSSQATTVSEGEVVSGSFSTPEELVPSTEYHFRVVAEGEGASETAIGAFRTLPSSFSGLPDGRVYEMVTPVENEEAEVYVPRSIVGAETQEGTSTGLPFQAALNGDAITYAEAPTKGGNGSLSIYKGNQDVAVRQPAGGWTQTNITLPATGNFSAPPRYMGFSSELSAGVLPWGEPLAPGAPEHYSVLYVRDLGGEGGYQPLFTAMPPNRSFGEFGSDDLTEPADTTNEHFPAFAGGSADYSHLLFEANDALISGGGQLERELNEDAKQETLEGKNNNYLYDSVGGHLSLVDVLPDEKVESDATFGAEPFSEPQRAVADFSNVISADGSRIFWTDRHTGVVYVREDAVRTVQVSAGAARYWTATSDGRYAFYTEDGALWRFDVEGEKAEQLVDASANVEGVMGVGEDGSYVYFVTGAPLANGGGPSNCELPSPAGGAGGCLYVSHEGTTTFIGTLSPKDGTAVQPYANPSVAYNKEVGDWQAGLGERTATVTPDGGSLVFMSDQSLTGYANDGQFEVYVYEAKENRLFCASCRQSGEPGSQGYLPISWSDTYIPRWISDGGNTVFFDSTSSLVARDTNGAQDVYEWEREGAGSCTVGSGVNGGCIYLLSGGQGDSESFSWLVGESANGSDAFIATRTQLLPQDGNENFDLYDARVGGVPPPTLPECSGTGCQGVPSPPPTFATPSSVTFEGVGNFPPQAGTGSSVKSKAKVLTRAQKLARALKACKDKSRKRRVSCEASARSRYARKRSGQKKTSRVSKSAKRSR